MIQTDESLINQYSASDTLSYNHLVRDHPGNTRTSFKRYGSMYGLYQTIDYYPFGWLVKKKIEVLITSTCTTEKTYYLKKNTLRNQAGEQKQKIEIKIYQDRIIIRDCKP